MNVEIKILTKLDPHKLVLVSGLPGIAYVGKLSVDYLLQQLKAELIGEIYSKYFPPYVIIKNDGLIELLKNELYSFTDENGRNIIFLTGNAQAFSPEGQYEISEKILEWAINNGLEKIFSIAALITNRQFEKPTVYGTATTADLLEEVKKLGVIPLDEGMISGENGLIMGLARKRNVAGVCLLGETRGYQTPMGQYLLDAKASKAVLEVITTFLDLKVNMEPLDKQASETDELVHKMVEAERHTLEDTSKAVKKPSYVT